MVREKLKKTGLSGIGLGALAFLACELPIILAVSGLGGLSAGAMALRPPPFVEYIAIGLALIGGLFLTIHLVRKRKSKR